MSRVAVDALGGDRAPEEIVAGALAAAADGVEVILHGPEGLDTGGLELVVAPTAIGMAEKPSEAVRAKPDSSMVSAVRAVADGSADAVVSAGNTGALLAAGLLHLRRLPGVLRPAIAIPMPTRRGVSLLLDAGANADCRPEHLVQFAVMGSVFATEMLEVAEPQVRLLSIGEEPEKGNQLTIEAHALLAQDAQDQLRRQRRGPRPPARRRRRRRHRRLHREHRAQAARGRRSASCSTCCARRSRRPRAGKLGGLLIRPAARRVRDKLDPDTYGGAYLLGLRGLVVISHGNSGRRAIANAIRLAARGAEHRVVGAVRRAAGTRQRSPSGCV